MANVASNAEQFPRLFGKYVLVRRLARGGMGELFLGVGGANEGLQRLCVIKTVLGDIDDPGVARRFLDEARLVVRLSHNNLVHVFDAGRVDGQHYLAMELVRGKDLRAVWNRCAKLRRRIPVDFAIYAIREVARGLAYAHDAQGLGLVHRDISPPNILVDYDGVVKVTDFGLAKSAMTRETTSPGVVFGRYSYLAPEQARGLPADRRSDVFSAAIVLWELLTGRQLFPTKDADPKKILARLRNPVIAPPSSIVPGIPEGLDAVVMRALNPDREGRYATATDFRAGLSEVLASHFPKCDTDRVGAFMAEIFAEERGVEGEDLARLQQMDFSRIRLARRGGSQDEISVADDFPIARTSSDSRVALGGNARRSSEAAAGSFGAMLGGGSPGNGGQSVRTRSSVSALSELTGPVSGGPALTEQPPDPLPEMPSQSIDVTSDVLQRPAELSAGGARVKAGRDPGDLLGVTVAQRYLVEQKLGEGGFGVVYRATHVTLGRSYALKVLRPAPGVEPNLARLVREARVATLTGHPHIVDVVDVGRCEHGVYLVMELLEGEDLRATVRREGRLSAARVVHIARQVCRAVGAAHDVRVVHRDLKSENIFRVSREHDADYVKVLDFGLAEEAPPPGAAQHAVRTQIIGTAQYMAPEQVLGQGDTPTVDVYGLGVVMFELLTGRLPFDSDTPARVMAQKATQVAPRVDAWEPSVPRELADVIELCLDRDPARRPHSMHQLEYELARVTAGRAAAVAGLIGARSETVARMAAPTGPTALGSGARPLFDSSPHDAGVGRGMASHGLQAHPTGGHSAAASVSGGRMPASRVPAGESVRARSGPGVWVIAVALVMGALLGGVGVAAVLAGRAEVETKAIAPAATSSVSAATSPVPAATSPVEAEGAGAASPPPAPSSAIAR